MELTLYVVLAWFTVTYFGAFMPKVNLVNNILLYMFILIIMISTSSIITLDLNLVEFTSSKVKYIGVILYRVIITPIILVVFVNHFRQIKANIKKSILTVVILILFLALELINLKLQLYTYVRWNFLMSILFYSIFIFIALILNKVIYVLQKRSEQIK